MPVQIAERWFETRRVDDAITLLWEPHVVPLMRCNIWHVRGRDRDLLIDTGMGIVSLREAARHLFEKPVIAVATHTHADHIGGHFEFEDCLVHRLEADRLSHPAERGTLRGAEFPPDYHAMLREAGYTVDDDLITALPHEGYDLASYRLRPATPTRLVEEGPLLDQLGHSNVADYIKTMRRLRELPVRVVHAGHDPSFGRARLIALVDAYLARRDPERQASQQHAAAS